MKIKRLRLSKKKLKRLRLSNPQKQPDKPEELCRGYAVVTKGRVILDNGRPVQIDGIVQTFPWKDQGRQAKSLEARQKDAERAAHVALSRWAVQPFFFGVKLRVERY